MWISSFGLLLAFFFSGSECLQLYSVVIPRYVRRGEDVDLACLYDLQGKELYSIKWYKDGKEFYRYEPSTRQKKKGFPQAGVKVDVSASNQTYVRLQDTSLRYTGRYVCEISTEAPNFATEQGKGEMHVVVFPSDGPIISGGKPRYEIGDRVKVNCTSHRSKPAARLLWYINNEDAAVEHLRFYPPVIHEDDLETVTMGLHFRVRQHHFRDGNIKLKCVSQLPDLVSPLYWQSREESALGEAPPEVSQVVDSSSPSRQNSSCPVCQTIANWILLLVGVILAR